MKFCCKHFETRVKAESSYGLNIRIIEVSESYIKESIKRGMSIKKNDRYNFVLSEAYEGKLSNNGQSAFIEYCPFCGVNLKKKYKEKIYVNEENHVW